MRTSRLVFAAPFMIMFSTICVGQSPSRELLSHLVDSWKMTGPVMKRPVTYSAEGSWSLQGGFFSLHMKDVAVPPTYEANLQIGVDSAKSEYVAHWLDSFGGAGARVVGFGPLSGDKIEIIYPYAERRFRNTFRHDASTDTWSLLIESERNDGQWSEFADHRIVRAQNEKR